jgi:hypothetical protein
MPRLVRTLIPHALVALAVTSAYAHDPPRGIDLLWASDAASAPSVIVANRGLVFVEETDSGPRFSLRCVEAYGANIRDRPGVFVAPGTALVVGVYNGVFSSSDHGCTWSAGSGLPTDTGETLGNLISAAGMPGRMFVNTRTFSGYAALFQSEDYGRTWTERFENPTDHQFDVLLTTPAAPQQLYAAGRWRDLPNQRLNFVTAFSQDLGAMWQEREAPLKVAAFALHPSAADVVFAYQPIDTLETQFRLLRSADRGATFATVLEGIPKPTVIAPGAEPSALWLGIDGKGGLYHSSDAGQHFERVFASEINAVSCLVRRQGRLWMCGNLAPNSNGVWYSDDDGFTFHRFMIFEDVRQQVACSGEEASVACSRAWFDYDTELHPAGVDAGANAPLGVNLDAGPRDAAGAPGQPVDAGAGVAADAGAVADGGSSVVADGGRAVEADGAVVPVGPAPGIDAGAGTPNGGSPGDSGSIMVSREPATAGAAGAGLDAGSPTWPPRKRRHPEGCAAASQAGFDPTGMSLLVLWLLLARTRRSALRAAK